MDFSPFEAEMRRRLFWQIIVLDTYYSESRGSVPMLNEYMFNTKCPLNISDEQLSPVSGIIGNEQEGWTEMSFSRLSQDASVTVQRFILSNPRNKKLVEETEAAFEAREAMIRERCHLLHARYIQYSGVGLPILWYCEETARVIIYRLWLLLQRPILVLRPQTLKPAPRDEILAAAVSFIEIAHEMETNPANEQWIWYLRGYVPWYPIAVVLAELCIQTKGWLVDRSWAVIATIFDRWSERVADSKHGGLWRPIRKLLEKARKARLHALGRHSVPDVAANQTYDWSSLLNCSYQDVSNSRGFKDLHYAVIDMIIDKPEKLRALLLSSLENQPQNTANLIEEPISNSLNTPSPINWEDWDNFVQTSINIDQTIPDAELSVWMGEVEMLNAEGIY
jgi:hypothetical protein